MMKRYEDRLLELSDNSIWVFTKQDTDFDEAFKAAKLFDEIPNKEKTNIEQYFEAHHIDYEINTHRHRVLVISQLYGLITKTPFFVRGGQYKEEKTTELFKELVKYEIGSKEYNALKTEQLIKMKIHAIIDTAGNNENYNILPVVFIFQVLKRLKDEHGLNSLRKDLLMTYVMTAANYSDLDDVINYIVQGGTVYDNIAVYSDLSRVLTAIGNNLNLFIITRDDISLNPMYEEYFYDNFIKTYDIEDIHDSLHSNVDYSQLLYFNQEFGINLIDELEQYKAPKQARRRKVAEPIPSTDGDDERDYIEKVDSIKEENINDKVAVGAHKVVPLAVTRGSAGRRFKINPILGKIAIKNANYLCEFDKAHKTFISKRTGKNFVEGHHLVPVSYQIDIWDKYSVNADCVENIISLCPNCHRAIHYGNNETKRNMIGQLFSLRQKEFKKLGLNLTLEELKKMYGVK